MSIYTTSQAARMLGVSRQWVLSAASRLGIPLTAGRCLLSGQIARLRPLSGAGEIRTGAAGPTARR